MTNCRTQAESCNAAAGDAACDKTFRSCLASLIPDAGAFPAFDGGARRAFDGGHPDFDGGRHDFDGSVPPAPVQDAGNSAVQACAQALGSCLSSGTASDTCADQAIKCLEAALPGPASSAHPGGFSPPIGSGKEQGPSVPICDAGAPPRFDAGLPIRPLPILDAGSPRLPSPSGSSSGFGWGNLPPHGFDAGRP